MSQHTNTAQEAEITAPGSYRPSGGDKPDNGWLSHIRGRSRQSNQGAYRDTGPSPEHIKALNQQFYITLKAHQTTVQTALKEKNTQAYQQIEKKFQISSERWTWSDAYEVEQQLVHLYDAATVEVELHRRLVEAQMVLSKEVAGWYDKMGQSLGSDEADHRVLLLRLVNDLQWHYTVADTKRLYARDIAHHSTLVFLWMLVCFFCLVVGYGLLSIFEPATFAKGLWTLLLVAGAGGFGAAFSIMTGLKSRMKDSSFDDLKLNRYYITLLTRISTGAGAALILFFTMWSGLLSGDMFLDFQDKDKLSELKSTGMAKLVVWGFLAGFSERLVPNLLTKIEGRAEKDSVPSGSMPRRRTPGAGANPKAAGAPEDQPELGPSSPG